MSVDVGEPSLDAVVPEGKRFVIEAKKMEDGGIEIVDREDVLHCLVTEFISSTMTYPGPDPCSREPCSEAVRIMVSALGALLEHGHAAEFSAPHHQGVLEQSPLLEIL